MINVDSLIERLEQEGYRSTEPRRVVLGDIVGRSAPFTSAELWESVQENSPGIGRATVFRTLDLLSRIGILQRIHQDPDGGRCHTYMACSDAHHHHLICNQCGNVTDFADEEAIDALVREVERHTDFKVEGHRLELVGRCADCQAEKR
jgi:Fur family transcriptional regulator, ferric uptake regulator